MKPRSRIRAMWIYLLAVLLSGGYYVHAGLTRSGDVSVLAESASEMMLGAMRTIAAARAAALPVERFEYDINGTGLIGLSWSEITTSGGNLEAKRTATDPLWAGVLVRWLTDAGIGEGDLIAASFSGSFPGLNLAVLSAVRTVGADLIAISSVGASNYGANHPEFTWLDMELALLEAGWPDSLLAQVTAMGGAGDMATGLTADGRAMIQAAIDRRGLNQLVGTDLSTMAQARLKYIDDAAGERPLALYVNVGGASASTGFCPDWVEIGHGFLNSLPRCPGGTVGVMHTMLDRGIPVLHLLNVRQLAMLAGVPIDRRF